MSHPIRLKDPSAPFYDLWESETPEERQRLSQRRLFEYIEFARSQSSFYRTRLEGFEPRSDHPMIQVPVLTSSELRKELPPLGQNLLSQEHESFSVFQSGGTTGLPKTSLFSSSELDQLDLPNGRGFYALGLNESDRAANLWAVGGLYMTFIHMNRILQQYGCMNFPFSNQTPSDFVAQVAKHFKINCFTGISSVVLNTLRQIYHIMPNELRITKIFYGGEHFYQADRDEMREKFGTNQIAAPGYGTVDSWYIGYQCNECPTGVFHTHDDQIYMEIHNEDEDRPCKPGELGMIYLTAFPRRVSPIVRYRVGDKAKWLASNCSCGRTTPLFQLYGRGDDVLRIGYDSIDYQDLLKVTAQFSELSGSIQIQKSRLEGKDQLIIRIESEISEGQIPSLTDRLKEQILEDRPSLRDFIYKKSIAPILIEIVPPGRLHLNPRTGKLIRVIDLVEE